MESKKSTETVLLGFGSNLGQRRENIVEAARLLEVGGARVVRMSSFYLTSPVGVEDQPVFMNSAAMAETGLEPPELLALIKRIELNMGRDPNAIRWGPRPVDIDILYYGRRSVTVEGLLIPHPRIEERLFVMTPLLEVAADFLAPDGRRLADVFAAPLSNPDFSCQVIEKAP